MEPAEVPVLVPSKETYRPPDTPRKIHQVHFGLLSPGEVVQNAEMCVFSPRLYERPERIPQKDGVLDRRLGVSNKTAKCETCGQLQADCTGHYGYIQLHLPVFHIGYFKNTREILQCICKSCSRVLLQDAERQRFLRQFRRPLERLMRMATFRKVLDRCKGVKHCPHCGAQNGVVKKATGALKLIHDVFGKDAAGLEHYLREFDDAIHTNRDLKNYISKIGDDLNPLRVQSLFQKVSGEDCQLLDLPWRLEHLLMTHVPVPPVCIRPSVEMDTGAGSNEDDLTIKLQEIVNTDAVLRDTLEAGGAPFKMVEAWDQLQLQCATYINSDLPGLQAGPMAKPSKPVRGFVQRLKGKQGRFRGNLSGKRVDFSGRTVISPDPNLRVDEVAVPQHVARVLTFPDRVTPHNIERLRQAILNGASQWPGANFVRGEDGTQEHFLKYGDRVRAARELRPGHVVQRHLIDGDIILFNRQPSLHRMSIMAHKVKVRPWRTFRFNECVCSPYNADFDGDEMNVHVPQTEEARAEASQLMGVMHNLCTPKNGEILVAATQDFLTSAFLLTSRDTWLTRAEVGLLASFMGDACDRVDLPPPALVKPVELWTGKQAFGLLLRPHADVRIHINLETKEKIHVTGRAHACPNDGFVCFRNSELLTGRVGKATLGGGNKAGLFQVLNSDASPAAAAAVMNRLAKLSARFIGDRGFSIGIDDVMPAASLQAAKGETVKASYAECQDLIVQFQRGKLELQPGCNAEQSLETLVTGKLNTIRETASKVCMSTLPRHNSPLIMSQCGSKGSPINIAQMVACVGQQSVSGKRAPNGFQERTLPHFLRGDKTPEGKGFVANSFFSGLAPTEFFFHTMAGREGLVDTAVKTAETGYMSRRLMKALEDLVVHYDGTVRTSAAGIVQLQYGEDGRDPMVMEGDGGDPVDFDRLLAMLHATANPAHRAPGSNAAGQQDLQQALQGAMQNAGLTDEGLFSHGFSQGLDGFLLKQVKRVADVRQNLGLPPEKQDGNLLETTAMQLAPSQELLSTFIAACAQRYQRKVVDAGSTVGAFGAQSIGEPGTQMTLKTFHFAGVASMNITLGVPRIKEIINHSKSISTPIMDVALMVENSERSARLVKARLERTLLGQVAERMEAVLTPEGAQILIRLDLKAIQALQLDVDSVSVAHAIAAGKLHLKMEHILAKNGRDIVVRPPPQGWGARAPPLLFMVHALLQALPKVIVAGVPTVQRAVISKTAGGSYKLVVEGTNLGAVLATAGVDGTRTWSNHVAEMEKTLGIEAARFKIMEQVAFTMGQHGMAIDPRHTMLLADNMTYKGDVLGITRFGIAKMKDSVLMLASFEKTTDHLFDAALHGRLDNIAGVSEAIIMGMPMAAGTGLFQLRQDAQQLLPASVRSLPGSCREAIEGAALGLQREGPLLAMA